MAVIDNRCHEVGDIWGEEASEGGLRGTERVLEVKPGATLPNAPASHGIGAATSVPRPPYYYLLDSGSLLYHVMLPPSMGLISGNA